MNDVICQYVWIAPKVIVNSDTGYRVTSIPVNHVCIEELHHHGPHHCLCGDTIEREFEMSKIVYDGSEIVVSKSRIKRFLSSKKLHVGLIIIATAAVSAVVTLKVEQINNVLIDYEKLQKSINS